MSEVLFKIHAQISFDEETQQFIAVVRELDIATVGKTKEEVLINFFRLIVGHLVAAKTVGIFDAELTTLMSVESTTRH